ncbi:Mitochondrial outer membrane protein porin of 36 kDa [Linum grandiflorum]
MRYRSPPSPGFYSDIGKNAADLLYKDYPRQPATYFKYRSVEWNFDLSCHTSEILPGLTPLFRFIIPDSSKVELRYTHDYVGLTAGVGVKSYKKGPFSGNAYNPFLSFSGILGPNSLFSTGVDMVINASTMTFDDFSAGLSFKFNGASSLITSLFFDDKLDTLRASFYYSFPTTAIAAELKHSLSHDQATTFTVGMQQTLFQSVFFKTRLDTDARFGAFIQLELWEKLLLAVAGEFDFRTSDKKLSKLGLSISI